MTSEAVLLDRIRHKDAQALGDLYDVHGKSVYSLAFHILSDRKSAEEITQDVFTKIWSHPEYFDSARGRFESWVLTVTRHASIDRLRRERNHSGSMSIDQDDFPELPDGAQTQEQRWRDLALSFGSLPTEQRDVISLAFYHGMSQTEIAEHLKVPLGTVKTRVRLAMDKLRVLLRDPAKDSPTGQVHSVKGTNLNNNPFT